MSLNLNLKDFLKYLSRYKWLLIIVPVICMGVTYFLVKKLPKQYNSSALISTGLTSQFQSLPGANENMDYFKLTQQFGNLLEMMKSKRVTNALSYQLILHDLKNPNEAFQKEADIIKKLSEKDRQDAIVEFEKKLANNSFISLADNGRLKLYDMLKATGYGESSINNNLKISRNGESDLIRVSYTSANPNLSSFVVNTFATDFIDYYSDLTTAGQRKSLAMLDTLLKAKQDEMMRKSQALNASTAGANANAAGAIVAQKQADMSNQRITEAQSQRAQLLRNISSVQGALEDINRKLSGSGGFVTQGTNANNVEIVNIDNQLQIANQRYVNNNFKPQDKATIDSLQRIKSRLIASSASTNSTNSATIRQSLIDRKIQLESDLASSKNALNTVEQELRSLGSLNYSAAGIAAPSANAGLMGEAETAIQEYNNLQSQYQQVNMAAKAGVKLNLAEPGLPEPALPSKNFLYLAFSGFSSLMLCLLVFFTSFALNTTITTPEQFERNTGQKVIGYLNYITEDNKDLRQIWKDNGTVENYSMYKDLLRSLRFELDEKLFGNDKVLGITSLRDNEGKSFLAGSLSYAFAMMGKNILLICEGDSSLIDLITNKNNTEQNTQVFESFIVKKEIQIEDRITILGRNQNNNSLLELRDSNSLVAGFNVLKDTFDIIIVDIDSSKELHNVKEWLRFCDKSIAVFESGSKVTDADKPFLSFLNSQKGFLGWVINKMDTKVVKTIS